MVTASSSWWSEPKESRGPKHFDVRPEVWTKITRKESAQPSTRRGLLGEDIGMRIGVF